MTTSVSVDIFMGFAVSAGDGYLDLSVSDQKSFKTHFITKMEDSREGIPASRRERWLGVKFSAADDGHINESAIENELRSRLAAASSSKVEFRPASAGPFNVEYVFYDGKRYCIHVYEVERKLRNGNFVNWKISGTCGSTNVEVGVLIELSWATTT